MEQEGPFSILPVLQPTWKRTFRYSDVEAISGGVGAICRVCQKNDTRYNCPKCAIAYCSVICYKDHSETCSEAFYRDRVEAVVRREQKEGSDEIHSILNRTQQNLDETVWEGELWTLAEALEKGSLTDEETERLLSPDMKSAFYHAVRTGQLSDTIQSWHPWWIPEYAVARSNKDSTVQTKETLDDRLLAIPRFSSLHPGAILSQELAYNAIDLLYSAALTLRQYHGSENARIVSIEASRCLLQASAVLRDDARYFSVSECLLACVSTKASIDWKILVDDVSRLWNRRDIAHTLLDVIVIIKAASKELQGMEAQVMRKHRKKLEFYLSWSRDVCFLAEVHDEVKQWGTNWSSPKESPSIDYCGTSL